MELFSLCRATLFIFLFNKGVNLYVKWHVRNSLLFVNYNIYILKSYVYVSVYAATVYTKRKSYRSCFHFYSTYIFVYLSRETISADSV